jgi:arginine/ornithine transport system permease protein
MKWDVLAQPDNLALYGEGIVTTLGLLCSSLLVGGVLALLMAIALTQRWAWLRGLVGIYTYVFRGTPLLIQVYLIYYGLGQLEWIQVRWDEIWPWTYFKDPAFCAVLALSLNTAAYTAEMLAGAIRETNPGEIEAAQAFGMSHWQVMWHVILPSALRRSLPAYGNEVVMMLQTTSLASAVPSLIDLTSAASRVYAKFYLPFEAYLFAALIFLMMTFTLSGFFKLLENRYLVFSAPRSSNG